MLMVVPRPGVSTLETRPGCAARRNLPLATPSSGAEPEPHLARLSRSSTGEHGVAEPLERTLECVQGFLVLCQ
jgi:hypothetical protein